MFEDWAQTEEIPRNLQPTGITVAPPLPEALYSVSRPVFFTRYHCNAPAPGLGMLVWYAMDDRTVHYHNERTITRISNRVEQVYKQSSLPSFYCLIGLSL